MNLLNVIHPKSLLSLVTGQKLEPIPFVCSNCKKTKDWRYERAFDFESHRVCNSCAQSALDEMLKEYFRRKLNLTTISRPT